MLSKKCLQVYPCRKGLLYPGASFVGDQAGLAMALLTVAVGCSGFIYAGEQSAMLDIANNFAGTLMGAALNEPS